MDYRNTHIRELRSQLAYGPEVVRSAQARRIEDLLPEILPTLTYPYEFVCYRITLFRSGVPIEGVIPGDDLKADLRRLLLDLSRSLLSPENAAGADLLTLREAAQRHNASDSALRAWKRAGLPLRYVLDGKGHHRLGCRRQVLERFLSENSAQLLARPARRRLTAEEQAGVLEQAYALRANGVASLSAAARQIADRVGVSPRCVERFLRRDEKGAAGQPLFAARFKPLDAAQQEQIASRFRQGSSATQIAAQTGHSLSAVYRALHKTAVETVLSTPIKVIPSPEFGQPGAEQTILGPDGLFITPPKSEARLPKPPPGLPPYLRDLYSIPLLTRDQESCLFRRYNFVKYRMVEIQEQMRKRGYHLRLVDRFESHRRAADALRSILVRSNLRLVVSIAKRHSGPLMGLLELISEGNLCLMRAVECYDYTRNARFSTYATWALTKHYARFVPETNYKLRSMVTGQDDFLNALGDRRPIESDNSEALDYVKSIIGRAIDGLLPRERAVIQGRYGLGDAQPAPKTLEDIATVMGVTRERIRQIEARALQKLRWTLGPGAMEAAGA